MMSRTRYPSLVRLSAGRGTLLAHPVGTRGASWELSKRVELAERGAFG